MEGGTLVTSVKWVPRGCAKREPTSALLMEEEVKELLNEMQEMGLTEEGDENHEVDESMRSKVTRSSKRLKTASSVRRSSDSNLEHLQGVGGSGDEDGACSAARGLPQRASANAEEDAEEETEEDENENEEDFLGQNLFSTFDADLPYALNDRFLKHDVEEDSEDEREQDSTLIRGTDCPLIACSTDPKLPTLELYLYDHETGALFVHHEINLGSPPLCVEWLNLLSPTHTHVVDGRGNFAAVGSYGHGLIEIWDLDTMDELEPVVTLGLREISNLKKKKKRRTKQTSGIPGHSAPVLALHRNPHTGSILASASADETVKIWDLLVPECVHTLTHHTDKVQALKWHPIEKPILLTAAYDRAVAVADVRIPNSRVLKGALHSDAESCCWDTHQPNQCWASAEDGSICVYDLRTMSDASKSNVLHHINAHDASCTGITDCSIPGLFVSCSLSGHAAVWNSTPNVGSVPVKVFERDLKAGPLFSVNTNPDEAGVFSFGGSVVVIWDVADTDVVNAAFNRPRILSALDHQSSCLRGNLSSGSRPTGSS